MQRIVYWTVPTKDGAYGALYVFPEQHVAVPRTTDQERHLSFWLGREAENETIPLYFERLH